MTIDEILNLGHISSSEVPNYTRIQTEDGYYMTAWTEGDDIRKYAGSNVYYLPVRENYDYPDLRVITVEEHKRLSSERDAELEINPLVIVLKPQEKEVLITSNGETIVTPDEGFNGLTEVNISVEVPEPDLIQLNLSVTENGSYEYDTPDNIDGYNKVNLTVDVPEPIFETETLSVELTENGTYNYTPTTDGYSSVEVTVEVVGSGGSGLVVPFEEIGYPTELKDELNNELNSKPLSDLEYSKSLYDAWNPSKTSTDRLYFDDKKLVYAPNIVTSNVIYMRYMFYGCSSLTTIPLLDTSSVKNMTSMFEGCSSLTTIPLLDTSSVKNMTDMFEGCTSLTTIPLLDTSSVTTMSYMFKGCTSLTTIPLLDTSSVTTMSYMFEGCTSLTTIPLLDTSSVTNMTGMFDGCTNLTSIPQLDTGSVTTMSYMFDGCTNLTSIPQFDASKVTDIGLFGYSGNASIVNLGGFVNLGMQKSVNKTNTNYFLGGSSKLTYEAIMNVINNLYDRATAGYSVLTLKIHTNTMALLSEDDISIATNKGWTLS